MPKSEKGLALIVILIGFSLITATVVGIIYLNKSKEVKIVQKIEETVNQETIKEETKKEGSGLQVELVGSEVLLNNKGKKSVLFKNVTGVSDVMIGPDGRTLHFKPSQNPDPRQQYCATIEQESPSNLSDEPIASSWDFKTIGRENSIKGCEATGFLKNSNYFAYIHQENNSEGYLVYEDRKTNKKNLLKVDPVLLSGFIPDQPQNMNEYWQQGVDGFNGSKYYYPQKDVQIGNKLLLAFGRLVVAVDVEQNQFIGGKGFSSKQNEDNYSIISTAFSFKNQNGLPFVIVVSQWEGPAIYAALIDLSNNNFKVTKLDNLDKRSWINSDSERVVWEKDSLLFNFTDLESIDIPKPYSDYNFVEMKDEMIDKYGRELENKLSQEGKYKQVKCDLHPGMATPLCEGLKKVDTYRYTAEKGLVKL